VGLVKRSVIGRLAVVVTTAIAIFAFSVTPAFGAEKEISVKDNLFSPKKVTVAVGDKVTWEFLGTAVHNVTVKKGPVKFKSQSKGKGYEYSTTIKKAGKYDIVCTLHTGMKMTLIAK
jgi:plastocyanin